MHRGELAALSVVCLPEKDPGRRHRLELDGGSRREHGLGATANRDANDAPLVSLPAGHEVETEEEVGRIDADAGVLHARDGRVRRHEALRIDDSSRCGPARRTRVHVGIAAIARSIALVGIVCPAVARAGIGSNGRAASSEAHEAHGDDDRREGEF